MESENQTNGITLLPCPFCGGEADEYEGDYGNGIYCMMCGAMVGEPIHLECRTTRRVGIDEAIAAWNARAQHGMLTAEQVREAIERHGTASLGCRWQFTDRDLQAIADELNAMLGSGTCEIVLARLVDVAAKVDIDSCAEILECVEAIRKVVEQ